MKKYLSFFFVFILAVLLTGCSNQPTSAGEKLFEQARKLEKKADYLQALDLYKQALPRLRQAGQEKLVKQGLYST